jgi:4-diphosphocytidyl-2-C-methyl-D-erythritol kinase
VITLVAPAKINLTLEVLGKRPDGFHEIRSIFQAVDLYDTLHFSESKEISITCNMPGWSGEKSLVIRAADLLKKETGCQKGAVIKIEKRIPLLSGLGGDSADAATVLKGLNELWKLYLSTDKLLLLAARLGSDVPFFVRGGTALVSGRGEIIEPLPSPAKVWLVLIVPDIPVEPGKTGRMYAALKPSYFTDGRITRKLTETLHKGKILDPSMLFNTFENIAFESYSGLSVYKEHLLKMGAAQVHLAGSGPTSFAIFSNKSKADDIYRQCQDQGIKAYLVQTL